MNDLPRRGLQLFYQAVYLNNLKLQNSRIIVDEPETSPQLATSYFKTVPKIG